MSENGEIYTAGREQKIKKKEMEWWRRQPTDRANVEISASGKEKTEICKNKGKMPGIFS